MINAEDKKLLEFAAKATGFMLYINHVGSALRRDSDGCCHFWNPLADDGDAFRLAVKLCLEVDQICQIGEVDTVRVCLYSENIHCLEYYDEHVDPCAATRRAIVRAAAEIGKRSP